MKHIVSQAKAFLSHLLLIRQSSSVPPAIRDNAPNCNCFLVDGKDAGYFQNHQFFDFRNISPASGEDFTKPPALLNDSSTEGTEPITSSYFSSNIWSQNWAIQTSTTSHDGPIMSVDSSQNVFIFQDGDAGVTYLALRAQRLDSFVSNCEVDSGVSNIVYSSMRTRTRLVPAITNSTAPQPYIGLNTTSIDGLNASHPSAPGAVLGFFTYKSDLSESDIEILTADPTSNIRYSNQPDYNKTTDQSVPGASTDATMPNNIDWTDWHDHRIDWFEGVSRWYVDDQLVLEKTVNVPQGAAALIMNLWSDGGSWSQNMTVGAQVVAGFQWVEMVYNVSTGGSSDGSQCATGCTVDDVKTVGTPEKVFSNAAQPSLEPKLSTSIMLLIAWLCFL